jgi:hypothetical protein
MNDPTSHDTGNTWHAADCQERLPFVCERAPWALRARNRHVYRFFPVPARWDAAVAACAAVHAHLVTVTDSDEHSFVASLAQRAFWIGGTAREPGRFRWLTGDAMDFSNFAPGEPDLKQAPTCVVVDADHLWHDRPCTQGYPFVCEID